jgi:hypothetical protein
MFMINYPCRCELRDYIKGRQDDWVRPINPFRAPNPNPEETVKKEITIT